MYLYKKGVVNMQILLAAHLDRLDLLCKMQTRPVRPGKIRKVVLDGFPRRTGKIVSIMTLSSSSPQKVKKVLLKFGGGGGGQL